MEEERARREAFLAAYEELLEPIFRYFLYRLGDRERAIDLAQDTFMRAWDYERKGGNITTMKPFLYTTANNLFKNELRAKRPLVSLDTLIDAGHDFSSDAVPADLATEARLLLAKVARLPEKEQEIIRLRYIDQLATKEIATMLGKTETAVSVRLHRAMRKLKELHEPTP